MIFSSRIIYDGLSVTNKTPRQTEFIKKQIIDIFKQNNLRITIEANKKVINFLDITLDLQSGIYKPYMKPNNTIQYVHALSNHPPNILKNIPDSVNKRLSLNSANETIFNEAAPPLPGSPEIKWLHLPAKIQSYPK